MGLSFLLAEEQNVRHERQKQNNNSIIFLRLKPNAARSSVVTWPQVCDIVVHNTSGIAPSE